MEEHIKGVALAPVSNLLAVHVAVQIAIPAQQVIVKLIKELRGEESWKQSECSGGCPQP